MRLRVCLGVCLGLIGGCDDPAPLDAGPDAPVLFLTQKAPPNAVMEALFQGPVELDQQGCMRLGRGSAGPTVVWPFGSRLIREKTGLVVQDSSGGDFIRIGANVRLGGGEITDLAAAALLPSSMLAAALDRCPGVYWIAGEVLPPAPR